MKLRNRLGIAVATATLGVAGTLGMSACSPGAAAAAVMSPEQSALTALGFSSDDVAATSSTPTTTPSTAPTTKGGKHPGLKRLALRRLALRGHVEHGQITVETKSGDKTIEVQRGTITSITSTSVTVKSTDGFSESWTFGSPINVVDAGQKSQTSALKSGETVGVAGTQTGSTSSARLIVVPKS